MYYYVEYFFAYKKNYGLYIKKEQILNDNAENHNTEIEEEVKKSLYVEKYEKDETSEWVVCLYGFGATTKMWRPQVEKLKQEFNVLLIDLPSHGKSTIRIAHTDIKTLTDISGLVVKELENQGIEKASFLCVSLGTMIFGGILKLKPEMVNRVVLCGAVVDVPLYFRVFLAFMRCWQNFMTPRSFMKLILILLLPLRSHKKTRKMYLKLGSKWSYKELQTWFNIVSKHVNILSVLDEHKKHILFIMGNEDILLVKSVIRKQSQLENSSIEIMDKCSHLCNLQRVSEFNRLAFDYLHNKDNN